MSQPYVVIAKTLSLGNEFQSWMIGDCPSHLMIMLKDFFDN